MCRVADIFVREEALRDHMFLIDLPNLHIRSLPFYFVCLERKKDSSQYLARPILSLPGIDNPRKLE